ncbi:hypothetical protein DFH08DRAFT_890554 [Mycena albidolilacea]|uniref:B box-type domain-containing protein n=1 Tax=Mycena albidolilacea TaxID=1033008 RepID=A0AAD6ZFJ8_9AGAR|nr:hypothetical protein DFH08DRAFT_890554 [Mycena albidolilacea]
MSPNVVRDACPLPKRRRLNPTAPLHSKITIAENNSAPAPKNAPAICASCHRATSVLRTLLFCTRCTAPMCAVCSRTCTARAVPPTGHLSGFVSSLPPQALSPRRLVLALNAPNTNATNAPGLNAAIKRKKSLCDDDPDVDSEGESGRGFQGPGTGCGHVVCRECCFESSQESTTTCYDCCSA